MLLRLLIIVALIATSTAALAQEPEAETFTADWSPILSYVLEAVAVVFSVVLMWGVRKLAAVLKIKLDEGQRTVIYTAIAAGIGWAKNRALVKAEDWAKVETRNKIVADTISYVAAKTPDAVAHFGLTPEKLRELIEARLPDVEGNPSPAAAGPAGGGPTGGGSVG